MGVRSLGVVLAGIVAATTAVVCSEPAAAAPIPATVGDWEIVQLDESVTNLRAFGNQANTLYAGTTSTNEIAIGRPGDWTVYPAKGSLLGIVDFGLPTATAYFEVFEGWNDTDFNGDGDRLDHQLRYAVNSTSLITHPTVRNTAPSDRLASVAPSVLTEYREGDRVMARMYGAGRVELTSYAEGAGPGVGTFIKADGTIIDTGRRGIVAGLAGDTPIVTLLTTPPGQSMPVYGDTLLLTNPPRVLFPPTQVFLASIQTASSLWMTVSEASYRADLNGDGEEKSSVFCEVRSVGVVRCVPNVAPRSSRSLSHAGPDGILIHDDEDPPRNELYYVAPGAAPVALEVPATVLTNRGTSLVISQRLVGAAGSRFSWRRVGANGISDVFFEQSQEENSRTSVHHLPDGRFLVSLPEITADLNGDGDRDDSVTHLLGDIGGLVNLGVSAHLIGYFDEPPFGSFTAGGSLLLGVAESEQSSDLNGDGDQIDFVLGVLDGTKWTNLRLAYGDEVLYPGVIPSLRSTGRAGELLAAIIERSQGDLNGDGDTDDHQNVLIRQRPSLGLVNPTRLLDTRTGVGYTGPKPVARQTVVVDVAGKAGLPPTGVAAVALNVTVTQATAPGYVTVWGDGTQPGTSNLNVNRVDQTIPNLVFAPVGADGKVRIYTSDGGHLIADVVAWFRTGGAFTPTATPTRLLDTRPTSRIGYSGAKPAGSAVVEVPVAGAAAGQLAVVNVTATDTTAPGYVTVWGSGAMPPTSNLNVTEPGMTIPNLVIAPVGADGKIRIFTSDGTHLIADLFGILAGPAVTATSPNRLLDTRPSAQIGYRGPRPAAGQTVELAVSTPPGQAVILNVTATGVAAPGYVTVWPSGTLPNASNLNPEFADQSIANLVIAPVGPDGKIRLYTSDGTHLIADSFGSLIP